MLAQLAMFQALGDEIGLTREDRRRALGLDERLWIAWTGFAAGGPLPAEPTLPAMLLLLAQTAARLAPGGTEA